MIFIYDSGHWYKGTMIFLTVININVIFDENHGF